jgi:hypothetical protein
VTTSVVAAAFFAIDIELVFEFLSVGRFMLTACFRGMALQE